MTRLTSLVWIVALLLQISIATSAVTPDGVRAQAGPTTSDQATGSEPQITAQESFDQNSDGDVDGIRYSGPWMTESDSLTVYSSEVRDTAALPSQFLNAATWVIDAGDDGKTELIIQFSVEGPDAVARIWDDQDHDGAVGWVREGEGLQITESEFPSLTVGATGGWFLPDGSMNLNIWSALDGCGPCNRTADGQLFVDDLLRRFKIDGQADWISSTVDGDGDGAPEGYTFRLLTDIPESLYLFQRTVVQSNEGSIRPTTPSNFLFWPLLPTGPIPGHFNYFDHPPTIWLDWTNPFVDLVGLAGYPIEVGFHINSYAYSPDPGAVMEANFENPMAYYDLADDHDGYPELHVRFEYFRPQDTPHLIPPRTYGVDSIQYSWNQANNPDLGFDFKVDLAGKHSVESTYDVAGNEIRMVPYLEIPEWVVTREWDIRTFVAFMTPGGLESSEGIYAWDTQAAYPYIEGLRPTVPTWRSLQAGYRAEYANQGGKALLFIDPVDGLLHLSGFEGGFWQITDDRELEYLPSANGNGIGEWQVREGGDIVSRLIRVPGGLIYSDLNGTWFRQVDLPDTTEQFLPPSSHESWEVLGGKLQSSARSFASDDLRAMFDHFGGSPTLIATGPMLAFSRTTDGVSFTVDATDSETTRAIESLTGSEQIGSTQTVNLHGSDWTSATANFVTPDVSIFVDPIGELETVPVRITVKSPGALGLDTASLEVRAVSSDGRFDVPLGRSSVDVALGEEQTFDFQWAPGAPGDWTIQAEISRETLSTRTGEEVLLAIQEQGVLVPPSPAPSIGDTSLAGWPGTLSNRIALMVALALSVVAAAGTALWRGIRLQ